MGLNAGGTHPLGRDTDNCGRILDPELQDLMLDLGEKLSSGVSDMFKRPRRAAAAAASPTARGW